MTFHPPHFDPEHFRWAYDGDNGVATITLSRPKKKNPLTFDSYAELRDTFRALVTNRDVRSIILSGDEGNFCSGGDVHEIIGPLTRMSMPELLAFTRMTGDLVRAMRACPQPIIASIEGVCAGAGAILAMASDLRVAHPEARTAFLFSRVGLSGADMGACAILPRLIGHGRAADLLYTGRAMSASEGHDWGFYQRVDEDPLAVATDLACQIATGPAFAHSMTKRQLDMEWAVAIDTALEMEAQAQAICMATNDFTRAFEAFSAKQKPEFKGD
ncbi:enoyl-CoA hydratase family protein [Sphingomicrobium lutaoense]|uniref:Enoyl-CoA hydratase/carnithine racemase n=1 Tax=Sphingomicrobium lutaoense TaxID=515949 RepID=A0A839Z0H4_9SPHN|nr:enoyl-CoA hydratase family protein [Sphingomicrobium lutaoense]MBB3763065.1 enoyl-CoA hydratase/carnithine racemase [Sphingomicrobium lutaoense]